MRKVRWSIRDDGNSTWCKHYHNDYIVFVTDCDGDLVEWSVWYRKDYDNHSKKFRDDPAGDEWRRFKPIATGEVTCGYDELEVGQAVAIEAMDSIIRVRAEFEAERKAASAR